MRVGFLGTGGSVSGGQRLNTSLVTAGESTVLLFDCSGTPEKALGRQGLSPLQIRHLFLTHSHPDHIYGLPSLVHVQRLSGESGSPASLSVYGVPPVLDTAGKLLAAAYPEGLPEFLNFRSLTPPGCLEFPDLKVEFFRVRHGTRPSLGFGVRSPSTGTAVLFSGDAEPDRRLMDRVDSGTILIHDCCGLKPKKNHTSAGELADALGNRQPRAICLCHLPALTEDELAAIRDIFRRRYPGKLIIPADGDSLSF